MAPKHEKLRRHPTFCYRVCRLDEELLKRYVPVKNMPTAELIMFPGFLTATKSGEAVWRQLDLYNGNCVFIISPSYGQFPVLWPLSLRSIPCGRNVRESERDTLRRT